MTAVLSSPEGPPSLNNSSSSNILHASSLSLSSQNSAGGNDEDLTITLKKGGVSNSANGIEHLSTPLRSHVVLGDQLSELQFLAISAQITEVTYSISDVQTRIFEIQELRHQSEAQQTSYNADSASGTGETTTNIDQALINLDERLETIASSIATIESLMAPILSAKTPINSKTPESSSGDSASVLLRKHSALLSDWEAVQEDAETLKGELREDKWLAVFRTVGEQAEAMMMSLEKAISGCQDFIWTYQKMRRTGEDGTSGVSSSSLGGEKAVNYDMFQSLLSSYEAKKRYYMPATTKVLSILDRSVRDRVTKNGECLRRHAEARARWKNLRERINRIDQEMESVRLYFISKDQEPEPSEAGSALSRQTSKSNVTNKSNYLSTPSTRTSGSANRSRTGSSSGTPSAFSRSMSPFKRFASKVTASVRSGGNGSEKDSPSRGSSVSGANISNPKTLRPINVRKDSALTAGGNVPTSASTISSNGTSAPPRPPPRSPFRPMGNKISTQSAVSNPAPDNAIVQEVRKKRDSNLFPFLSKPPPPSALTRGTSRAPSRSSMSGGETSSSSSKPKWNSSTKIEDDRSPHSLPPSASSTIRATPQRPSIVGQVFRPLTPSDNRVGDGRRSLSRAEERERPATSMARHTPWNSMSGIDNGFSTPVRPGSRSQSRTGARTPNGGLYGTTPRTRPQTPSHIPAPVSYSSAGGRSPSRAANFDDDDELEIPTSLMQRALEGDRKTPEPKKRRPSSSLIPVPTLNVQGGSRPGTAMSMGLTSRSVSPSQLSTDANGKKSPKESPSVWRRAAAQESPSDLRKAGGGARSQTPEAMLRARAGGWLDTLGSAEKAASTSAASGNTAITPGSKARSNAPSSFKGEGRTLIFGPGPSSGSASTSGISSGTPGRPPSRPGSRSGYGFGRMTPSLEGPATYIPSNTDELDVEVAKVVNGMAHGFIFERIDPPRRAPVKPGEEVKAQYAVSNALTRKVITCRLVTVTRGATQSKKVMCRVGGGWLELSMYILNRQAGLS